MRVIRVLHASLLARQYQSLLHKLTILRLFAKLLGFVTFSSFWRLSVCAVADKQSLPLFFT